jgi:hypothetical protein
MGTKENPGRFDCHANALPDEPMFVLLARDIQAPGLVFTWAMQREDRIKRGTAPETDWALVLEAYQCGAAMKVWREENPGKWRQPRPAPDPTAQSGDLTIGQRLVADYEMDSIAELSELAAAIDREIEKAAKPRPEAAGLTEGDLQSICEVHNDMHLDCQGYWGSSDAKTLLDRLGELGLKVSRA